jgi:hypothetical protein
MNSIVSTSIQDPAALPVERLDEAACAQALAEAQALLDVDAPPPLDAIIHGARVRLHTHNPHWTRFWSANWFAPDQWASLTTKSAPAEPQVHLYAIPAEAGAAPWAGYSREQNTGFLRGDTPYGPLRALALGAVARKLAEEEAVHCVAGTCLKRDGRGTLLLYPPDLDPETRITALSALMEKDRAHLVALDSVFIRYGLMRMVDGVTFLPTLVIDEKGHTISGFWLFPWLEECGYWEPRADTRCLTLDGEEEYCFARDLDLGRTPEAFAFPLEQAWYLPTQIVAAEPALVGALWHGGLENVPPLTPELWQQFGAWADQAAASSARALVEELGQEQVARALCRLRTAPHGRAMASPATLWPGRAGGHPWRPVQIERVALLEADKATPLDSQALSQHIASAPGQASSLCGDEISDTLTHMLARATQTH